MKLSNNLSADYDSLPVYTIGSAMPQTYSSGHTISGHTINSSELTNSTITINTNGIEMQPGTDIVIGGQSLMKTLDAINQRLAILQPNTRLESEWTELKELGERYRAMEQDLLEKARAWDILKSRTKR